MFSTKEYLEKKTGPYGVGRFSYLQSLVTEFQDTASADSKEQVLANLANFAYDPINYEFIRKINIIDLFLDCLEESNPKLVEFAVGGLCNLSLDRENKEYILKNGGVALLKSCLSSPVEETVLSAVTTLMFLITPTSKAEITSLPVIEALLRYTGSRNKRISNLATIFLEDYCSPTQIEQAKAIQTQYEAQVQAQAAHIQLQTTQSQVQEGPDFST